MDKIILKLLKENGRVIIPDFGALIVKQKTPFTVIFNEFLQYNDGALVGAIAEDLNIERDDAAIKVKDMTNELQDKLSKGEDITLTEVGILSKSATGKIALKDLSEEGTAQASSQDTTEPVKDKPKTVEFDLEEDNKPIEPETKPMPTPSAPATPPPPPTPPSSASTSPSINKETPKVSTSETDKKPTETAPINEYYAETGNKKTLKFVLWILIILIVNGALVSYFILFNDEIKSFFANRKNTPVSEEIQASAEAEEEVVAELIDSLAVDEDIPEVITEDQAVVENESNQHNETFAGTKYYVVAGVFSEESNADKLVDKLNDQGYNSEKFAKIGRMYAVSYDVFPSKKDADRLMLKVKNEFDSDAWIKIID